jgi:hypothetical protein
MPKYIQIFEPARQNLAWPRGKFPLVHETVRFVLIAQRAEMPFMEAEGKNICESRPDAEM